MKRIAWMTDIHLNFLNFDKLEQFCNQISKANPECILIAGDIAEAPTLELYLKIMENEFRRPVYFVLGNHDYYRGSLKEVQQLVKNLTEHSTWLHWLTISDVVELTQHTCLIGHGSWADGRFGDYQGSELMLNDYVLIKELTDLDKNVRLKKLNNLGDKAAAAIKSILPEALARFRHVILLTHVPPFEEACWHQGRISDDNYLPHFSCKAFGEVLIEMMQLYPNRKMTVLCGHTHGGSKAQILANLSVITGAAIYGKPEIQQIIKIN